MATDCGTHHYQGIDQSKIDAMMNELRAHNCVIDGTNPWQIDTRQHGIKLQAQWDQGTSTLAVTVTDKSFYVPCAKIWEFIEGVMPKTGA